MPYSNVLQAVLARLVADEFARELRSQLDASIEQLVRQVTEYCQQPVTPVSTLTLEETLDGTLREMGRGLIGWTFNQLEGSSVDNLPAAVQFELEDYRRLNQKTPNRYVATRFGTITLWRHGYRPSDRDSAEATIFPLEQALGLMEGATPALAERVGLYLAEAGATQQRVLDRLQAEHGVVMGVKRLRELAAQLSKGMTPHRHACQVERVLEMLHEAYASRGRHKPVLAVGRDGITLGQQPYGFFEVASTATVTVYDRRSRRVGTVQLAFVPEFGQGTMTTQLTHLLEDILRGWAKALPRLCYVTDAGDNEVGFYKRVLKKMWDPRTGKRLKWQWITDYYHASERITVMAEAIFGVGQEGQAWARKMRKLLLKPGGVRRVLYSAAALRSRRGLKKAKAADFRRAYNYLRDRTQHMNYAEFKRQGLPIGSGITEAACKTVFTQRLKLSGMRWKKEGAQTILNLRVILLSGIWKQVYRQMLAAQTKVQSRTYASSKVQPCKKAA